MGVSTADFGVGGGEGDKGWNEGFNVEGFDVVGIFVHKGRFENSSKGPRQLLTLGAFTA